MGVNICKSLVGVKVDVSVHVIRFNSVRINITLHVPLYIISKASSGIGSISNGGLLVSSRWSHLSASTGGDMSELVSSMAALLDFLSSFSFSLLLLLSFSFLPENRCLEYLAVWMCW